ncbi:MAG TPA: ABC transporter permease [Xanthobacteraceae bacterium]|nr:ABC transporter permease [Xanthobacteraceae bacterium]
MSVEAHSFSPRRISAIILRHWYLLRSSWPRLVELAYWPAVQMFMWGFLQLGMARQSGAALAAASTFLAAFLLWDLLFRGQIGFSMSFMEEMWSRNLPNLMISPLRPAEFMVALMAMSVIRLCVGFLPVTILAIVFFGFNLWGLGLALVAFFANLFFTAWAVGMLCSGLVMRNGLGAEGLTWSIMFIFLPLTCVYYPVTTLPAFVQPIAWALPPTAVFEGMRALVVEHVFRTELMAWALGLNLVWLIVGAASFVLLLDSARKAGALIQTGE